MKKGPILLVSILLFLNGAPGGNRTRVTSLGSWCSTIELQMRKKDYRKRVGVCLVGIFVVGRQADAIICVSPKKKQRKSQKAISIKRMAICRDFYRKKRKNHCIKRLFYN